MKIGSWTGLLVAIIIDLSYALPQREATTTRTTPVMRETLQKLADQLMEVNSSSVMGFDTRTPPRVKQQMTKLQETVKAAAAEKSHPGVAVPIDEEHLLEVEDPKKMTFYKNDKPTTDSGISTWILLSGQNTPTATIKSSTTPKAVVITKEEVYVQDNKKTNSSTYEKPIKPLFKRRPVPTTTKKPTTIISTTKESGKATSFIAEKKSTTTISPGTTKIMKVKASVVNSVPVPSAGKNSTKKITTSTSKPKLAAEKKKKEPTEFVKVSTKTTNATVVKDVNSTSIENNVISPEAKDGGIELSTQATNKKTRRPTTKKKKNKKRKTKPAMDDKIDTISGSNNTKLSTKNKEKPFSTQIYNYLSREVMPTVGVGLVGLMVTAGLASYFLYPFGALRRSYDIDRKDKEGLYYKDPYMGGVAEEEMIGKVIAGMPAVSSTTSNKNTSPGINYNRIQGSRNTYPASLRYRQVETKPQGSVESVDLPYSNANYQITYNSAETAYTQNTPSMVEYQTEKQFVVGNIPKELEEPITPAVVPEHGPRRRKRRQTDDVDNEIDSHITKDPKDNTTPTNNVTESIPVSSTVSSTYFEDFKLNNTSTGVIDLSLQNSTTTEDSMYAVADRVQSILDLVKDLILYKLKLGLEILQNKTISMSRYLSRIQSRIDHTYREG